MLILLPILLALFALFYGSAVADYIGFNIFLKRFSNPFYRLGIYFMPGGQFTYDGETYEVLMLSIGMFVVNIDITFYTTKPNDTATNPTHSTILG